MGALVRWLAPLRVRIALLVAGAAAFTLIVTYAIAVPSLEQNLVQDRVAQLGREADSPAVQHFLAFDFLNDFVWTNNTNDLLRLTGAQRVAIYSVDRDAFGRISQITPQADSRMGYRLATAPELVRETLESGTIEGHVVTGVEQWGGAEHALAAVYVPNNPYGTYVVVFAERVGAVRAAVGVVRRRIVIAGAIALGLAALIGAGAAQALVRRLRRLRASAERIAAGRLDVPIVDPMPDEIGDLARSLDTMRQRLERVDRARNEFIANASHELRTPLTSLSGSLELVSEDELEPEARLEFLTMMREQLERLTRLASDLLDLSRLDAGGVRVARDEVDLAAAASASVREAQAAAARRGTTVELAPGPPRVPALGDEARVHQVLRALIDNAVRHTGTGTTVTVSAGYAEDGGPALWVRDDGQGIPAEAQNHVFERFYRGRGAAAQGSGLGLAIALELAERMGGTLQLRSRPGETVFTLELAPVPLAAGVAERVAV